MIKFAQLGYRKFAHTLVGYHVPVRSDKLTLPECKDIADYIERCTDPLLKSLFRQQLAEEMGLQQERPALPEQRLIAVDVRARELGIPQSKINKAKTKGYWSLGSCVARDGAFKSQGKIPLGSFMVHQYFITDDLDNFIQEYFEVVD